MKVSRAIAKIFCSVSESTTLLSSTIARLSVLKINVSASLKTVTILILVTPFAQRHVGRLWAPVAARRHSEFNGRALLDKFDVIRFELGDVEENVSTPRAPDEAETAVSYVRFDDSFFSHKKPRVEPLGKTRNALHPRAHAPLLRSAR